MHLMIIYEPDNRHIFEVYSGLLFLFCDHRLDTQSLCPPSLLLKDLFAFVLLEAIYYE